MTCISIPSQLLGQGCTSCRGAEAQPPALAGTLALLCPPPTSSHTRTAAPIASYGPLTLPVTPDRHHAPHVDSDCRQPPITAKHLTSTLAVDDRLKTPQFPLTALQQPPTPLATPNLLPL